ncbi:MFS transporter, DHA1 family, bicyclomycin/chloramphenicol resistance protein [Thauera chlorobenzoica]|uniref:Bcr/CflA family drug exporter n=2 Tax=Thauera chlorobenzoica TaxID=96773 RepID=A0A1H5WLB4_9RHOO|nr:Bcr/CflA family drug exporter [Thauera chlorobenzoica]SEG00409.1 MFS transporter, DHA1 family, bicyclomycin/chloramphenicol resistance protein [Thauera chlorobenzoica]
MPENNPPLSALADPERRAAAAGQVMSSGLVVLALSLLLGIQPVTTDLYLPALPAITAEFGASLAQAQLTLSGMLLAFGLSQLVWGPVSDRFGRRPVLLAGLAGYTVAAAASALAQSMEALVVWRIVQGAAMGASVMCARALVRDLYCPELGARVISKGLTGLGVIACLNLPLGGFLAEAFGWRITLLAPALFAAAALGLVALRFRETLGTPNPRALAPSVLLRTWRQILAHPTFWAFTLLSAASYGGLFTILAMSSFVFITLMGMSKFGYGLLMVSMTASYLFGTVYCRHLLVRVGVRRAVTIGGGFSALGGTLLGVLALAGVDTPWGLMPAVWLFAIGHGIHQACGQAGAVGPFPQAAGAASALSGFLMMLVAFGMGSWLGLTVDGSLFPMASGVWFWGVVTALVAWGMVRRVRL